MILSYFFFSAAFFTVFGKPVEIGRETNPSFCQWRGTGPICFGACFSNEKDVRRSAVAPKGEEDEFGSSCLFGHKAYCCARNYTLGGHWRSTLTFLPYSVRCNFYQLLLIKSMKTKVLDRKCGYLHCTKEWNHTKISQMATVEGVSCNEVNIFGQTRVLDGERAIVWNRHLGFISDTEDVWIRQ